ncbi:alpha/beta fold hydrolase [Pseudonocardia sp. N23]|uniref:alpha/beta fold hydrolase n=1 Tax=Pseudonocardia sp. N23 TaxID=1987376 RepID=UPI000BFBB7BF|nr:alpha/beta fold hydrolase [Pseudonocardia sp. N23]GAY08792.1 beta-ketoadipate enol-lactone hydrolase [Pseudonocardia sp. N23]
MPFLERPGGVRVSYTVHGPDDGALMVLVMGTGSPGRVWNLHQVPAFTAAGHRVATLDNRGIPPSDECAGGMTLDDMAGDVAALVELLGAPARVVGTSLGARIVAELALARPDLVGQAVLLAAHGRPDPLQRTLSEGERALHDAGIELPPRYHAAITAQQNLSRRTLADPVAVQDWLDLFEFSGSRVGPGVRAQLELADDDRLAAYRGVRVPTLVVGFADDMVLPPHLSREVADAIPGARYVELADCGHFGYLERPDAVNALVLEFVRA